MATKAELQPNVSSAGAFALAINGVIGSGIFILPSLAAVSAGFFSPWLFILLGLAMLPIVSAMGRLARLCTETGGPAAYVRISFGAYGGTLTAWVAFAASLAGMAAASDILIVYLSTLFPSAGHGWLRSFIIFGIWSVLGIVNIIGIKQGARTVIALTMIKLIPLAALVLCVLSVHAHRFGEILTASPNLLLSGASILPIFYAFVGFEGALAPAGETRDAANSIPRAIFICILASSVFYFLVQTACLLADPELMTAKAPLAVMAITILGLFGRPMISCMACLSVFGTLASGAVTQPRYLYALATNWKSLASVRQIHPRFQTPWIAIACTVCLNALVACLSSFMHLARWVVLAKFVLYTVSIICLFRLEPQRKALLLPALGLVICGYVLSRGNLEEWLALGGVLLLGAVTISLFADKERLKS